MLPSKKLAKLDTKQTRLKDKSESATFLLKKNAPLNQARIRYYFLFIFWRFPLSSQLFNPKYFFPCSDSQTSDSQTTRKIPSKRSQGYSLTTIHNPAQNTKLKRIASWGF